VFEISSTTDIRPVRPFYYIGAEINHRISGFSC